MGADVLGITGGFAERSDPAGMAPEVVDVMVSSDKATAAEGAELVGTGKCCETFLGCRVDTTETTGEVGGVIGASYGAATRTSLAIRASGSTSTSLSGCASAAIPVAGGGRLNRMKMRPASSTLRTHEFGAISVDNRKVSEMPIMMEA